MSQGEPSAAWECLGWPRPVMSVHVADGTLLADLGQEEQEPGQVKAMQKQGDYYCCGWQSLTVGTVHKAWPLKALTLDPDCLKKGIHFLHVR